MKFGSLNRACMFGAICLLVSGVTLSARAQSLYDETLPTGVPSNYPGGNSLSATVKGFYNGTYENAVSGLYPIQFYRNPTGAGSPADTVVGFCVDINQPAPKNTVVQTSLVDFGSNYSSASYNYAANGHTKQQNTNAIAYLVGTYDSTSTSRLTAAEVNVAIWDIATNGGAAVVYNSNITGSSSTPNSTNDFEIGSTSATSDVASFVSDINSLIDTAYSQSPTVLVSWIKNSLYGDYQDFAVATNYDNFIKDNTTPEPGAVAILIGFGIPAGVFTAKHRRKHA